MNLFIRRFYCCLLAALLLMQFVPAQAGFLAIEADSSSPKWMGFKRTDVTVAGRPCIIVEPNEASAGNPWIWRMEFFGHEPQGDSALAAKGFHVVYMDVQNMYGAPVAMNLMDQFYNYLVNTWKFNRKTVLEGFSRGGLFAFNWAERNPEKVGCIYVDAPVCDFKSWPGGKQKGQYSKEDWEELQKVYGFKDEQEAINYKLNPVDNLKAIAAARIPILAVCGETDVVVPMDENINIVKDRIEKMGGKITLIVKPNNGHHPHSLKDPAPIVDFVMTALATNAKAALGREARLAKWYNADTKGGLFVHWGLGTGRAPGHLMYPNVQAFEEATAAANWSPQPIVDAAVKLNCKYIVWATMHVEHGLTRTWRSKIPGTPVTKRDYLGELCHAAASKGIRIVVYMPGDAGKQKDDVKSFIDAAGYAAYKNLNIDIKNNNNDWVRYFLKDAMFDVMDNYPDVIGFWCDGWDSRSVDTVTLSAVHAKNNDCLIFRNEYSNAPTYDDEDVMGVEPYAKILSPKFDKASGMYVQSGNGIEGSFLITDDWWHIGTENSADPKWCIKMAVSALGANAVPCYGEGATISGSFVSKVNTTNLAIKKFFDHASAAVNNVWGGGYAHGGFKSGTVGNGAYVATTMTRDGNTHFIHVLDKPVTNPNQLIIPMLGYKVTGVKSPGAKKDLAYSFHNDDLVISVGSWADFNTYGDQIIQITTAGRPGVLSHTGWTISASNVIGGYPASNAIDSSYGSYYSSETNAGMPVDLVIDMGVSNDIYGINLDQYEARALTTAKYYPANEGTRIRHYEIYASDNGSDWGPALVSGTLENERGVKEIQIPQRTGNKRYIKLKILSNYKGNGVVQIANIDLLKR